MGMPAVQLVGVLGLSRAVEGRLWPVGVLGLSRAVEARLWPISWAFLAPSLVSWNAAERRC